MKKMKRAAIFAALVLVVVLSTGCGSENTCSTSKELNYAISNGNYAAVQEIMKTNKGMNLEQLEDKKDGNDSYEERRAVGILLEHGCGRVCDILKILVSSGAKLDSLSSEGQSYLNMTSDYDCLTVLLENGANPNMQCKNGYSAFDNFIKELPADKLGVSKTVKYIDLFIQHGAVFSKNSMEMAKKNDNYVYMMKYIGKIMDDNKIDSGLSEQEKHALEGSPIMQKYKAEDLDERTIFLAATYCDAKTLMIMEKNGVDFNITNARGETPLDAAAMFNPDSKAVKYLAGKCKLITYDSSHVERNCLSYAVYGEYEENIHTLWTKNVKWSEDMFGDYSAWITPAAIKIAEKYGAGFSPKTDIAPAFGYLNDAYLNSVMRAIVKEDELAVDAMNACIEAGNKDTAAKLFEAEGAINGDIVEYAIRAGFGDLAAKMISRHPECISQNGRKIMEAAIETGELKVAEAAIETGNVKVNEVNDSEKYGCTLLHVACRNPSSEMIELFRQHGADFSLEDSEGKKAKEIARETGFVNVINAVK